MADHSCVKSTAMISSDEALKTVLEVARCLPPIVVSLHDAMGKVLAQDIRASDPLPPYPASIKVLSLRCELNFCSGLVVSLVGRKKI